ncbi:MAG: PUR family DNA/RNA-binding protein [Bacteroidales bacterium]|nr:PUR family DNA/RNA-binding protein [Bacteroidales bacterium]
MEEFENKEIRKEEVFSRVVRAGKRTYFFDVKATRTGENYLTVTESKRRFDNEQGKFFYEKHKIFLYREDFNKFLAGLNQVVHFVETGEKPEGIEDENEMTNEKNIHTDVDFEDLGSSPKDSDL